MPDRTTPLRTVTPLERTSRLRSSGPTKARRRDTGPTKDVRDVVRRRFDGRCARCGRPGHSVQHRQPRQIGGSPDPRINALSNLVWLCGDGTTLCHGAVENADRRQAYVDGYLVRRPIDPAGKPMLLWDGRRVLLDDLGGYDVTSLSTQQKGA